MTLYQTLSQGREFLAMTAAGAVMAAAALAFSGVRRLIRAGIPGSLACDCLLGALWAAAACLALTVVCRGRARAFHFLAMLCGGALFTAAVPGPVRVLGRKTRALLRRAKAAAGRTGIVRRLLR